MKRKNIEHFHQINQDLNPDSAEEKGYEFVANVFNPYQAILDLEELAQKMGYTFGLAKDTKNQTKQLGLYKKIT